MRFQLQCEEIRKKSLKIVDENFCIELCALTNYEFAIFMRRIWRQSRYNSESADNLLRKYYSQHFFTKKIEQNPADPSYPFHEIEVLSDVRQGVTPSHAQKGRSFSYSELDEAKLSRIEKHRAKKEAKELLVQQIIEEKTTIK